MTHSQTRVLFCCIALFCMSACKQAGDSSKSSSTNVRPASAALREPASEEAAAENAKHVRVQELTALIATAQTEREVLAQTKSTIEAQLAAYQADSTATLDQLKAEMQALQRQKDKSAAMSSQQSSAKQMAAFNERARNQLEHALAMDQEYQTQLARATDDLRKIDANMAAMQSEIATLRTGLR